MIYQAERGVVVYRSKDGREVREFASLDWLSEIISYISPTGANRWCAIKILQQRLAGDAAQSWVEGG
jgi:hypothetical protein